MEYKVSEKIQKKFDTLTKFLCREHSQKKKRPARGFLPL